MAGEYCEEVFEEVDLKTVDKSTTRNVSASKRSKQIKEELEKQLILWYNTAEKRCKA